MVVQNRGPNPLPSWLSTCRPRRTPATPARSPQADHRGITRASIVARPSTGPLSWRATCACTRAKSHSPVNSARPPLPSPVTCTATSGHARCAPTPETDAVAGPRTQWRPDAAMAESVERMGTSCGRSESLIAGRVKERIDTCRFLPSPVLGMDMDWFAQC